MMRLTAFSLAALCALGARPMPATAQATIGAFQVEERPTGADGISRSYISGDALGTTFEYLPSLFWRCMPGQTAAGALAPNIELGILVDEMESESRVVGVQWRFDSEAAAPSDGWILSSEGGAVLAPAGDREAFTLGAQEAREVLIRVADDEGAYDSRFNLEGLEDALAQLPCSSALRNPEEEENLPTFTPFTQAPQIINREEVLDAMRREYPPDLRSKRIGGRVRVFFFVDERGYVREARVDESSGHHELDDAALRVARVYRFTPALNDGEPVPVWVNFPVTFAVR